MICRMSIFKGYCNDLIELENGPDGVQCRIGEKTLQFTGKENKVTVEQWKKYNTIEDLVDVLGRILDNAKTAESYGISREDYEYYEVCLSRAVRC